MSRLIAGVRKRRARFTNHSPMGSIYQTDPDPKIPTSEAVGVLVHSDSTMGPTGSPHRGFSLIELLVSIAVMAVLLAILIPGLVHARNAGYGAVCANNLRQIGTAWQGYLHEHDSFPRYSPQPDWRYGGVVFAGARRLPVLDPARPINRYLDSGERPEGASHELAALYRCPADKGIWDREEAQAGRPGLSVLGGKSAYDFYGTSYRANPYLMDSTVARIDNRQRSLKLSEIAGVSSRLILMGDPAWYYSSVPIENPDSKLDASWHAPGRGNILALDGSVRSMGFQRESGEYDMNPADLTHPTR